MDRAGQTLSATRFAELTGVSRERLRTWERRFGFPAPTRVAGGPRRYALEDVPRVVAVRRAAHDGVPLNVAISQAADAGIGPPAPAAFEAAVELAPIPVALITGPEPLRLAWANAALRALPGVPRAGSPLHQLEGTPAGTALQRHFAAELAPTALLHPAWEGPHAPAAQSTAYRLPVGPGEAPMVALMATEPAGEREALTRLAAVEEERDRLRDQSERHDRWLDALADLAEQFQHEPALGIVEAALDVLIRHTGAIDASLANYESGRMGLHESRRGLLEPRGIAVAAHPQIGRALRATDAAWLEPEAAAALGIPEGLHGAGLPATAAGEALGLLVLVFDEVAPLDRDDRRLMASVSTSVGLALLRDRLVRELQAAVSSPEARHRRRTARRASDASPPGG